MFFEEAYKIVLERAQEIFIKEIQPIFPNILKLELFGIHRFAQAGSGTIKFRVMQEQAGSQQDQANIFGAIERLEVLLEGEIQEIRVKSAGYDATHNYIQFVFIYPLTYPLTSNAPEL